MTPKKGFLDGPAPYYLAALGLVALVGLMAPWLGLPDPDRIEVALRFQGPNGDSWLGRDELGRDVLSRLIWGSRVSLGAGVIAALAVTFLGAVLGAMAGYFGRWVDTLIMRLVDVLMSIPSIYLVLMLIVILGPSLRNVILVIIVTGWTSLARVIRSEVMSVKEREFVKAAHASGAHPLRVLFRHVLPNVMAPVYVSLAFGVAGAILMESGLSFLGIGVQPPTASWGSMLDGGRQALDRAPWLVVAPGLAIFVVLLLVNGLAESARSFLDPREQP